MKEKILTALVAVNGQYNLPKEYLERIAATAPTFEKEDEISSWVESQRGVMSLMQAYADSRVTEQVKVADSLRKEIATLKDSNKGNQDGDLEKRLGNLKDELWKGFDERLKTLQAQNDELQKKVAGYENGDKERQFSELKKRVAKEIGLSDVALGLVEGKLTPDMTESKVNEVLSGCKKSLIELGLTPVEGTHGNADAAQVAAKRAEDYLKQFESQK